jgi:hypothetical protein
VVFSGQRFALTAKLSAYPVKKGHVRQDIQPTLRKEELRKESAYSTYQALDLYSIER